MNQTIMHINYAEVASNFYGSNTVDSICRMAADIGFDGIEFRGTSPKHLADRPFADYVAQIAEAKKKYNLSNILFGLSIENIVSEDKELRVAGVQKALEKAQIFQDLCGTTLCNTYAVMVRDPTAGIRDFARHGSAIATQEHWDMVVESYQLLAKGIEPMGMRFAFETHANYIHDLPASSKKLVDLIDSPNVGINMDYGNTVYFAGCPSVEETIDIYGDKLFYTHLKNSVAAAGDRSPTALSEGAINHRAYLKKLKDVGFAGPIAIEAPRPGDRFWFAKQDYAYYKAVVSSL